MQDGTLPLSRCKYKCIFYTHKIFPAIKLILVKKWWRLLKKLAFVLPAARLSGRCGGLVCRRHGGRRPWLWRLSAHAHATPCGTGRCGRPSFARRKAVDCDAKGRASQHETRPFVTGAAVSRIGGGSRCGGSFCVDFLQQAVGVAPLVHHEQHVAYVNADAAGEVLLEVDVA